MYTLMYNKENLGYRYIYNMYALTFLAVVINIIMHNIDNLIGCPMLVYLSLYYVCRFASMSLLKWLPWLQVSIAGIIILMRV